MAADMIRATVIAVSLFVGLTLPAWLQAKEIDREKLNPALASILKVEAATTAGGFSLGTAVSIAPGRFVTNCHVTAHAVRIDVLYQGLRWPVQSQSSDLEHDLCLLDVPKLRQVAVVQRRSAKDLKTSEDVVALGYTFGAGLLAQGGNISALHPFDGSAVIQSTTPFNSGASGGGLFDAEGALIGILTFRLPGAEGFYFSLPIDWVIARIDDASSYIAVAPLDGPPPFWARPNDAKPYFMRATTLEALKDWQGLIKLTEDWGAADSLTAEPWLLRGQAYTHIGRDDAAIKSFKVAVQREPQLALGWFNLGEACVRRGRQSEVLEALMHLRPLDARLADELAALSGVVQTQ